MFNGVKKDFDGVKVDDACKTKWFKLKSKEIKACNFKFTPNFHEIIVDKGSEIPAGTPDAWGRWVFSLPMDECRYAIYDVELQIDNGETRNKPVFIHWAPGGALQRQKMVSASAKDVLTRLFDGIEMDLQFNEADDLKASNCINDFNNLAEFRATGQKVVSFE